MTTFGAEVPVSRSRRALAAGLVAIVAGFVGVADLTPGQASGAVPAAAVKAIPAGLSDAIRARFGPGPIGLGTAPLVSGIASSRGGWRARSATPALAAQISPGGAVSAHLSGHSSVSLTPAVITSGRARARLSLGGSAFQGGRLSWRRGTVSASDQVTSGGLEQRFTVNHPLSDAPSLTLALASSATWRATRAGSAIVPVGLNAGDLTYAGLRSTDARGHVLPSYFETGAGVVRIVVATAKASYPITIDPTWTSTSTPTATLTNGASSPGDTVGHSVALSTDGTTALVGAPEADGEIGAVYVFHGSAEGAWTSSSAPAAILSSSAGTPLAEFGASVALTPDGTTALIGAPLFNDYKGAAYVFHVSSEGAWSSTSTPAATLSSSTAVTEDEFGASVAVSSDATTAVIGAPGVDSSTGAAYVFNAASAQTWSSSSTPTVSLTQDGSRSLGDAVALSSDGTTAAIGAGNANSGNGAAYVFAATSETTWDTTTAPAATLTSSSGSDEMGTSIAISSNGTTVLAGAPGVTSSAGEAFVFNVSAETSWVSTAAPAATLTVPGDTGYDNVGDSVALSSDGTTALVGAAAFGGRAGAAYVFHASAASSWSTTATLTATLTNSAGSAGDLLGDSVAFSADGSLALIGSPGFNSAAGAADLFDASSEGSWTSSATPAATLTAGTSPSNDAFGTSVALSDDGTTALVGAPTVYSSGAGVAYIFHVSSQGSWTSTPVPTATLTNHAGSTGDLFGGEVALSGDGTTALIGATGVSNHAGAGYVFHAASETAWTSTTTPLATLTVNGDVAYDELGNGVALSSNGSTALVSDEGLGDYTGAAYVFHAASSATWKSQSAPKATLTHGVQGDWFGAAVAFSSDGATALIDAWGANGQKGAAYIFHAASQSSWTSSSTPKATLTNSAGAAGSEFGYAVGLSGDGTTALIGAYGTANLKGAAYIYHVSSAGSWASATKPAATLTTAAGSPDDEFGMAVALSGDGATALIAAPRFDTYTGAAYEFDTGSEGSWASTSSPAATLTNRADSNDSDFAAAVGLSADGTVAIAGAWGADDYAGTASVFLPAGGPAPPGPPAVTTGSASKVSPTGATLNSTINPGGSATTYSYQYGTTTSFGRTAPASGMLNAGAGTFARAQPGTAITGLSPATTYHYRACANNATTGAGASHSVCGKTVSLTTTAPAVTGLKLSPRKLTLAGRRVGGRCEKATHANRHHAGCRLTLTLHVALTSNIAGTVTITIDRDLAGKRVNGRCVKPTHRNRKDSNCTRSVAIAGHPTRTVGRGETTLTLTHAGLPAGKYVVTVTLKAKGKTAKAKKAALTITA
jgi:hypothetical protein